MSLFLIPMEHLFLQDLELFVEQVLEEEKVHSSRREDDVTLNQTNYLDSPRLIGSELNEELFLRRFRKSILVQNLLH